MGDVFLEVGSVTVQELRQGRPDDLVHIQARLGPGRSNVLGISPRHDVLEQPDLPVAPQKVLLGFQVAVIGRLVGRFLAVSVPRSRQRHVFRRHCKHGIDLHGIVIVALESVKGKELVAPVDHGVDPVRVDVDP